ELELESADSAVVRSSSALCRAAFALATWTSAALASSVASTCPALTCWPTSTVMALIVPLVRKSASACLYGLSVPLPDTTLCTTPRFAVTSCWRTVRAGVEPTSETPVIATATAAATSTRAARVGRLRLGAAIGLARRGRRRRTALAGARRRHAALLQRCPELLEAGAPGGIGPLAAPRRAALPVRQRDALLLQARGDLRI